MKLRKREIAAILKLVERFGVASRVNIGLAIGLLEEEVCMNKKTARNTIKRLAKFGFVHVLRDDEEILVEIEDPLRVLKRYVDEYLEKRLKRCRKPSAKT
ncbi:MAG: hypothetical protein QXS85_06025 [Acidilobaceae archaeon]